jgi:diamine N-acetyltransferase
MIAEPPDEAWPVVTLASGERIRLRPLRADDAERLGAYLRGLSAESQSSFGPHPSDQPALDAICAALDPRDTLRLVGVTEGPAGPEIVAYILLQWGVRQSDAQRYFARDLPLDPATDCTLAPSVADAYQGRGLGSALMGHAMETARAQGRRRMVLWGGVQAANVGALAFYRKLGFVEVGSFQTDRPKYDMILIL